MIPFLCIFLLLLITSSSFTTTASSPHNEPPVFNLKRLSGVRKRDNYFNSAKWDITQNIFDQTFFVAIASFRDVECPPTILDMMRKAANPRRIFLGIIEQNEHGDPSCVPDEFYTCNSADFCPLDNIRRRITVSRNGRGPCFGRYVSMLMYRGENYFMSMDSHNQFTKHWDEKSIFQLHRSRSSRPAISHYPNGWDKNGWDYESPGNSISMTTGHYLSHLSYIRMDGRWMLRSIEPKIQPYSAGGYLVADALLVHDVPFDPYLDYLFDGEEILYSVRSFTHGFDWFTPGESVLYHDYNRHKAIRFWAVQGKVPGSQMHAEVQISQQRAQLMMEIPKFNTSTGELLVDAKSKTLNPRVTKEWDKYTIGKARTMENYNWFAKLDAVLRKTDGKFADWLESQTFWKSGK
jgi:UDP-GlcNAc:polypeptide alpha-N-acetylglucosaminyltransferase